MSYVKVRLMGLGLFILSVFVIVLSFFVLFLNYQIKINGLNISQYFIKVLNFLIILGIFGYLAYVGILMLTTGKGRK